MVKTPSSFVILVVVHPRVNSGFFWSFFGTDSKGLEPCEDLVETPFFPLPHH